MRSGMALGALVLAIGHLAAGCSSGAAPMSSSPTATGTGPEPSLAAGFPIGQWTTTITEDDLRAGGVTSAGELSENMGTFTLTLSPDGSWTIAQQTEVPIRWPVFRGTYQPTGADAFRQRTEFPPDYAGDEVDFTWRMQDGSLVLAVPDPPDHILPIVTESHPWERAG